MLDDMTARASSTTFVGREAELAMLVDALKRARAGEPSAVLLGGEAGVGKSRLVDEFRRLAGADGVPVYLGYCLELGEEGLPFAPFAGALRVLLRERGPDLFAGSEREFARFLPELGGSPFRSTPVSGDGERPDVPVGVAAATNRGYLYDLVARLFEGLAEEQPLVLVLEDLHWADRSTRDLLAFLIRGNRAARVLLLATYRSDELHRGHPLRPFLAELDRVRGVERRELDRLDRDGTAAILADLLGAEPPGATVDNIHDRAQGNPFFIEELAACTDKFGCPLPDSLRDLLLARVDRLDEAGQRVLRIASAGGNRIAHGLLAQVAGLPEAELEAALRAAVAAQLLLADPDGGYEFRHALVREAVHDDLLPGEHARLHARYAAVIEADPDLVGAGRAAAETAHHWHAAHDYPRAISAAMRAADEAGARYAYAERNSLLERALELWEQVPDAADRIGLAHLDLVEASMLAAVDAGETHRALSLTRAALSEVDRTAEPGRAARLLIRRGKLLRIFGKSDGGAELRQAYELAGAVPDRAERADLLGDIASHLASVDRGEGGRIAAEAMALADGLDEVADRVAVATMFGRVCSGDLAPEVALVEMRRGAERAERSEDPQGLVRAMVNISDVYYHLGAYADSAAAAERAMVRAGRIDGGPSHAVLLLANHAEALIALGRWDEADAGCGEAARLDPPGTMVLPWLLQRVRVRLARGHPRAGELVVRALGFASRPYLPAYSRIPLHELAIGVAANSGDPAKVEAAVRCGLADPEIDCVPRYGWPLLAAAARAARTVPDEELVAEVRQVASRLTATYPPELAYSAQMSAELTPEDPAAWGRAVEAWRADGQPYPLAVALYGLAGALAGAGDRSGAVAAIEEAAAIATGLGAAPLIQDLSTLARRIGVRLAARPATPVPGPTPLTDREREVLRLVAEGHSNRSIATELYISPKTASVHVSRIIAKLAVANRVEAAAVARRLGLLG